MSFHRTLCDSTSWGRDNIFCQALPEIYRGVINCNSCLSRICCLRSSRRCPICQSCPSTARACCWRDGPRPKERQSNSPSNCAPSKTAWWSCSRCCKTNKLAYRWERSCVFCFPNHLCSRPLLFYAFSSLPLRIPTYFSIFQLFLPPCLCVILVVLCAALCDTVLQYQW